MIPTQTREQRLSELTYYRGRVAMTALLKALGIGQGAEVAIQAFTCLAVPEGIMALGAKPVYVDIEVNGFNMSAQDLDRKLSSRVQAIVLQHTFGIPANMNEILAVANYRGIPVIEDCCHTINSSFDRKLVGSFGVGAFYSFEWGKPIVTGIGGAAVVNKADLLECVRQDYKSYFEPQSLGSQLRLKLQYWTHGVLYRPMLFWPVRALYHKLGALGAAEKNYNPVSDGNIAEDFSLRMASYLRKRLESKLANLDKVTAHSSSITNYYINEIKNPLIQQTKPRAGCHTVFARYPIRVFNKSSILKSAKKANVELADWYATPIHPLQPSEWHSVHYEAKSCPQAERRCVEVVSLPTHSATSKRDAKRAIRFLNNWRVE